MTRNVGDRLMTVDERGKRLWVYADIVQGVWRKRRRTVASVLLLIYLILPWISWKGLPLLQFDVLKHRLIIFGNILDFSEANVILTSLLGFAFLTIAFTSIAGRVWCGWGCPQTVFLDFIFRPIEKWLEGRPYDRKKRDELGLHADLVIRKSIKWFLYALASFVIANTFVAYFTGRDALFLMMEQSPFVNPGLFGVMVLVFAGFMFNFGWFREQMCTLVCPYGRLQSVLLDKNSYVIAYNAKRGEPRGKNSGGDCVDCNRCVQVCPTGIDIRNGLQLECINCSACIDACNIVMSKINKPQNLISYTTENKSLGYKPSLMRFWRPAIYLIIATLFLNFSIRNAFFRDSFSVLELKNKSMLIQQEGDLVRNQVGFIIKSQSATPVSVKLSTLANAELFIGQNPITLLPGQDLQIQMFIQMHKTAFTDGVAHTNLTFTANDYSKTLPIVILRKGDNL